MKGFGTVVTGTLISGTIRREEELEVFPTGRRVRVRGLQVHGTVADSAVAGQRTALNLAGATVEDLSRGMTLAPAATFETTRRVDVKLRLLASAKRPLKHRARVHFHAHPWRLLRKWSYPMRRRSHRALRSSLALNYLKPRFCCPATDSSFGSFHPS